jgi:hypothetical protein
MTLVLLNSIGESLDRRVFDFALKLAFCSVSCSSLENFSVEIRSVLSVCMLTSPKFLSPCFDISRHRLYIDISMSSLLRWYAW